MPSRRTPRRWLKKLHVPEGRIFRHGDLVLDRQAAARAAELPELRHRIDEAPRVADDRVRGLDRQVASHAMRLVVVGERTEVRGALRAGVALGAHRQVLGGEKTDFAVQLPSLEGGTMQPEMTLAVSLA